MRKTTYCQQCNQAIAIEGNAGEAVSIRCPNCGVQWKVTLSEDSDSLQMVPKQPLGEVKPTRPLGIIILAALLIIGVIISIAYLFLQFPVICDVLPAMNGGASYAAEGRWKVPNVV